MFSGPASAGGKLRKMNKEKSKGSRRAVSRLDGPGISVTCQAISVTCQAKACNSRFYGALIDCGWWLAWPSGAKEKSGMGNWPPRFAPAWLGNNFDGSVATLGLSENSMPGWSFESFFGLSGLRQ